MIKRTVETPEAEVDTIGKRIKRVRGAVGLSQQALAQAADVSMNGIARLEQDSIKDPHLSQLRKIAAALGVSVGELVGEEEQVLAGKAEAPAPGPLLDMALAAARRDEEKLWQAVNRADASEGMAAVTEYEEDKFRAQVRALGFPDEYFEGFIWPLVQEAVRAGHLEQENARLKEENAQLREENARAHVND